MMDFLRRVIPATYRPYEILCRLAWRSTGGVVADGPFRGMKYLDTAANSSLVPKLLGLYERELSHVIHRLVASRPQLLVDAGCAEGYYAVGFARRCPALRVIAFDRDDRARRLASELARINGVERQLDTRGTCTTESLQAALGTDSAVVICDVEGFEKTLLDPDKVPALVRAHMLVEVHDALEPGAGAMLKSRFAVTHRIETIAAVPRTAADCPPFHRLVRLMPRDTITSLIVERPDEAAMYWLYLEPK